jgi:hypothetical protein
LYKELKGEGRPRHKAAEDPWTSSTRAIRGNFANFNGRTNFSPKMQIIPDQKKKKENRCKDNFTSHSPCLVSGVPREDGLAG